MSSALLKSDAVKSAASIAALLLGMANAHADPAPQDNRNGLQALAFAAHQTNYSGTFVYQHGNRVEVSNIAHLVDSTGEYSRLDRLDGPPRTIIRKNDEVWCYLGNREVRVALRHGGRTFPALLPEQLSLLNENYQIRQGEASRVAGFPVHAIVFQPRDALRYVHKMWAHDDSGLLLQAAVLDERGNLIEQYTFTQLTIGGNIDRNWITAAPPHSSVNGAPNATSPAEKAPPAQAPAASEPESIASGWLVDVPPGFKKIAEVRRQLPGKTAPVIQLAFSDGLAGISVFIEKAVADNDRRDGLLSQGVIQAYSRTIGDQLVTVIGELPPRTVMQIAQSVRERGE